MAVTYITIYVLLPNFYKEQKPIKNVIFILLLIIISLPIQEYIMHARFWSKELFATFLETCFIVSIATALVMSKNWLNLHIEKQAIEKEKVKAELAALKSQINPHFFFNTLNNIYSLVIRNENEKAAIILEELSDLMSKVLYESSASRITIEKELEIIQHYIHIQEMRFAANIELETKFIIHDKELMIPPMLLFFFVENCYKHSGNMIGEKIRISLELKVIRQTIFFKAVNTIPQNATIQNKGVGIENTRKRLNLIYKTEYELKTIIKDHEFIVELTIDAANDTENQMFDY